MLWKKFYSANAGKMIKFRTFRLFNLKKQTDVVVTVDETGDMGSKSKYFVYGATTLKDAESFANVVKQYSMAHSQIVGKPVEIGFSKTPDYRVEIINNLNPYMDKIYVVAVKKPNILYRVRRKALAEASLELLSDMVAVSNESDMNFIVDESSLIKNQRMKEIIEGNDLFEGRHVECNPTKSVKSMELQGNDYIIGSIGHAFETGDPYYKDLLASKPKIKRVRMKK